MTAPRHRQTDTFHFGRAGVVTDTRMAYDAILFDNDGVLTEPTPRNRLTAAIRAAFGDVGVETPTERHVESLLDVTVDAVTRVCAETGIEDVASFWGRREARAVEHQRRAIEGGEKGLYEDVALAELNVPIGIVSNNQNETVRFIVDHFDLADHVEAVYGREPTLAGIRRKKPRPFYLRRALSDLDAEEALYVGDSRVDVAAAEAAGLDVAFLRREHRRDYALDGEPTVEIESLSALPSLLDGAER